jgi:beta-glucosidase
MTDWYGGKDAVAQMKAGNDMIMPGMPSQVDAIIAAVKNGSLEMKVLDKNVERILQILVLSPRFKQYPFSNKPDLKAHAVVARQAAADGIVLLKNNQSALPLATSIKKIAVFGNASYETYSGGTGSGDVNEAYTVNIAQGLVNAGFDVNKTLEQGYEKYILAEKAKQPKPANPLMALLMPPPPVPQMPVDPISPALLAAESDAAIITLGRNAGEGGDRKNIAGDFQLTQVEADMIEKVCDAFHAKAKKVIVILNIGGVIETASWCEKPDAILLAWQGGQETGNAIADIITGKVNPSGKLATTFPLAYEDVPSSSNFPGKILASQPASGGSGDQNEIIAAFFNPPPAEVVYEEGIYVGYRYFNSFGVKTAFPFGFGLSYTTFGYSALKLASPEFNGKKLVSVTITNTGKAAGREVVQMYVSAPAKAIDKPRMELKGFQKTKLLQPGESQTLNFTMDARSLSSFHTSISAWVLEPGAYTINVGASIDDIKLDSKFTVKKQVITEKVNPVLAPQRVINELVRK